MPRTIWLVRHGERIDNVDPDWRKNGAPPRGQWDDPHLTKRGHQQASEVGVCLAQESIDFVFTSPFFRCLETTDEILQRFQRKPPVFIEPGFCESLHATQDPPGYLEHKEAIEAFPELPIDENYKPFFTKESLPKNETTCNCCFLRVSRTLKHVLKKYDGNFLIVSHGSPIAGCHFALTGEYAYCGQCTISKYGLLEEEDNPKEENAIVTNLNETSGGSHTKVAENKENALRTGKISAQGSLRNGYSNSSTGEIEIDPRRLPTLGIVRVPGWKVIAVGDKSHLSDKKNLRETLLHPGMTKGKRV